MTMKIDGKTLELKSDGTFSEGGKVVATFVNNELRLADGKHVVTVGSDGAITVNAKVDLNAIGAKFDDKNNLTTRDKGQVLTISDDGKATLKGKQALPPITGFKPELRRAAALMIMFFAELEDDIAHAPPDAATSASATPKKP